MTFLVNLRRRLFVMRSKYAEVILLRFHERLRASDWRNSRPELIPA